MNTRYGRIAALWVSIGVLTALFTGEAFVLLYADHDHTGEACPTCAQMKDVADVLRRLLEGLPVGPVRHSFLLLFVSTFLLKFFGNIRHQTLITRKVRLND
jgi:hypothetical protein